MHEQTLASRPTAAGQSSQRAPAEVAVIGLGYVGMTLAVALADAAVQVLGYDANREVAGALAEGRLYVQETGVGEILGRLLEETLQVTAALPRELPPTVIVCVGTPVHSATSAPDLSQFESAIAALGERISPGSLVVLRSTVPIGSSRKLVLEPLRERIPDLEVAFCPERTVQGRALEELHRLPQIVGASSQAAGDRAQALFERLTTRVVRVSSLEAAEAIKLICNAHTDLIYGFGNEIALIAEATGLDAWELIASANLEYPRPDLSRPGFVGGGCLTKDPYLLAYSARQHGYEPGMVLSARKLNEHVPLAEAQRVLDLLEGSGRQLGETKVLITGIAYKGQPETDDTRGAASTPIVEFLRDKVGRIVGHDFIVGSERIEALGIESVSIEDGFDGADAVLVLTGHLSYRELDLPELSGRMRRPAVIFDMFGIIDGVEAADSVTYLKLGRA